MNKTVALLSIALPLSGLAQAQNPSMQDLKQQARELTLLSRLAPEDQEKFQAWRTEQQQVAAAVRAMHQKALQAYVDALKDKKSVQEARLLAEKATIDDRIALAGQTAELRNTFQQLAQKYPFLLGGKHNPMKSQFKKQGFMKNFPHKRHR